MKILFITNHLLVGKGGGIYATKAYINAFSTVFDDVTLVYPAKSDVVPTNLNPKIKLFKQDIRRSNFKKIISLLTGSLCATFEVSKNKILNEKFDIIIFDNSKSSSKLFPFLSNEKIITIHHNFEQEYTKDNCKSYLKYILLFWIRKNEKKSLLRSDLNLVLTKSDKFLFKKEYKLFDTKFEIIGSFLFEDKKNEKKMLEVNEDVFIITGNLSTIQTEASLIKWFKDYFPLLKKKIPQHKLVIAGKNPSSRIVKLCSENGAKLFSSPLHMFPILNQAKYYMCPTELGGGLKLRNMDGLKSGLCVITHKVSSRGYEYFKEKNCLFDYDDKKNFCEAVTKAVNSKKSKIEVEKIFQGYSSFNAGSLRLKRILIKNNFVK